MPKFRSVHPQWCNYTWYHDNKKNNRNDQDADGTTKAEVFFVILLDHDLESNHGIFLQSRKWQENGWEPRWFRKNSEAATFGYVGGYWEARAQRKWDGCPDIFGDFSNDSNNTSSENNSKS